MIDDVGENRINHSTIILNKNKLINIYVVDMSHLRL